MPNTPAPTPDRPPADLVVDWSADRVLVIVDAPTARSMCDAWIFAHPVQTPFPVEILPAGSPDANAMYALTPDVARRLADCWELLYASGGFVGADRPLYLIEAAALKRAAAYADRAAGRPMPALAPVQLVTIPGGAA